MTNDKKATGKDSLQVQNGYDLPSLGAAPGSASVVANKLAEGLTPSWYEAAALLHDHQILSEVGRILKDTQHQLQDMRAERDWLLHLVATIRDKGNLRYNGNVHMLAFSDLKDEANRTFHSPPNVKDTREAKQPKNRKETDE